MSGLSNQQIVKIAINNIVKEGITDVDLFSSFFEIEILKDKSIFDKLVNDISKFVFEKKFDELKFKKNNYILFPKSDLVSYRKCALVSFVDEIKYLSLVLSLAKTIEKKRINKSKNIIFSYRINLDKDSEYIFDEKYNFYAFRQQIGKIIKDSKYKVMIKCDISNFYDRINIHRLDSKLKDIFGEKDTISKVNDLLLYWADRNSYSLPVGSNASRILAEVSLIDVDNFLYDNNIKFVRFVDDFRIFANDIIDAQRILNMLINRLDQEGLFLNSKKTEFIDLTDERRKDFYCLKKEGVENKENNNQEEKRILSKIIRGYNGNIPTKFRSLSAAEIHKFKKENSDALFEEKIKKVVLESNDIIYLIKVLLANERFDLFLNLNDILNKFPQLIPYYINAFLKNRFYINDSLSIRQMKLKFLEMIKKQNDYPNFVIVYVIKLFENDEEYVDELYNIYKNLPKNCNPYIGRRILEAMEGKLKRYQLLELKSVIPHVNEWEQREILNCLAKGLCIDEFKPIFKDYAISSYDQLITKDNYNKIITILTKK